MTNLEKCKVISIEDVKRRRANKKRTVDVESFERAKRNVLAAAKKLKW